MPRATKDGTDGGDGPPRRSASPAKATRAPSAASKRAAAAHDNRDGDRDKGAIDSGDMDTGAMPYDQLARLIDDRPAPAAPPPASDVGKSTPALTPTSPSPPPAAKRTRREAFRYRILPRSVLGVSSLILAFAIGAGFSGVVLFSYYQYKLNQTNTRVNALVSGYKTQFAKAEGDLGAAVAAAKANIADQLKAVQEQQATPAQLATLTKQMAPSVYFVHTYDANGQASVGTAFVVSSSSTQSLLLTSYTTVAAATHTPGPTVYVRQGTTDTQVTVRAWDTTYDLALLIMPQGNLPALTAAPTTPAPQPGDRLFAVSGLGTDGASLTQAAVVDVSSSGLAVDAAIGQAFQGGPMINQAGQLVAVASRAYSPVGFVTSGIWYSPYVEAACSKVLSCPGGTLVGST